MNIEGAMKIAHAHSELRERAEANEKDAERFRALEKHFPDLPIAELADAYIAQKNISNKPQPKI